MIRLTCEWDIIRLTCDTLPDPVNTNNKGPIDLGMKPNEISYPASRIAAWAT